MYVHPHTMHANRHLQWHPQTRKRHRRGLQWNDRDRERDPNKRENPANCAERDPPQICSTQTHKGLQLVLPFSRLPAPLCFLFMPLSLVTGAGCLGFRPGSVSYLPPPPPRLFSWARSAQIAPLIRLELLMNNRQERNHALESTLT